MRLNLLKTMLKKWRNGLALGIFVMLNFFVTGGSILEKNYFFVAFLVNKR